MLNLDYKSIFKKATTPIYIWQKIDKDLILVDFNNAAKEITEGKIKEYLGIKASELYKEQTEILEDLYSCINYQKRITREMNYRYQSTGKEKYLDVIYEFVPPNMILVNTKDKTKQREAEENYAKVK